MAVPFRDGHFCLYAKTQWHVLSAVLEELSCAAGYSLKFPSAFGQLYLSLFKRRLSIIRPDRNLVVPSDHPSLPSWVAIMLSPEWDLVGPSSVVVPDRGTTGHVAGVALGHTLVVGRRFHKSSTVDA